MMDNERIGDYQQAVQDVKTELQKTIVGMETIIDQVLTALLANGHVLLEGVPGLGKTLLVQTLSDLLALDYRRIQFTPDLMPADITGTNIIMEDEHGGRFFQFQAGPLFANLVLADEINRATAKTQAALLEAMQERSISVAGTTRPLDPPFFVMATQNPIEMEGTYSLPEAQIDRFFFKLKLDYPTLSELNEILLRTTGERQHQSQQTMGKEQLLEIQRAIRSVPTADEVLDYAARIVLASQPQQEKPSDTVKQYVRYGSSPRGAQALVLAGKARAFLEGRFSVSFADIRHVTLPSLRHRILLNLEGEASNQDIDRILTELLEIVPETP